MNDFNSLIGAVAGWYSPFVSMLDANRLLSPRGSYVDNIDGVQVRTPDHIHLTMAGVQQFIDPELSHMAVNLGVTVYEGRL